MTGQRGCEHFMNSEIITFSLRDASKDKSKLTPKQQVLLNSLHGPIVPKAVSDLKKDETSVVQK